jgi:hypothetical protein
MERLGQLDYKVQKGMLERLERLGYKVLKGMLERLGYKV